MVGWMTFCQRADSVSNYLFMELYKERCAPEEGVGESSDLCISKGKILNTCLFCQEIRVGIEAAKQALFSRISHNWSRVYGCELGVAMI
jgi:hypothetical protein